jgi:hypothetical protein
MALKLRCTFSKYTKLCFISRKTHTAPLVGSSPLLTHSGFHTDLDYRIYFDFGDIPEVV